MKKSQIIATASILLVVVAALRWPRIDPDVVKVTHSDVSDDHFVVEYRMSRPFAVQIEHGIRESRSAAGSGSGISFQTGLWRPSKNEVVATINSSKTLLRGEHSVRLRVYKGRSLGIEFDGKELEVNPWLEVTAANVVWFPPGESVGYGNGVGDDILHFHTSSEQTEYLMVTMGSDLRTP